MIQIYTNLDDVIEFDLERAHLALYRASAPTGCPRLSTIIITTSDSDQQLRITERDLRVLLALIEAKK